jgi:hypothetical protein
MNTTNDNFLTAARKKIRFDSGRGSLAVEDLFDLSLPRLDALAVNLSQEVEKLGRRTFLKTAVKDTNDSRLKLDLVVAVIEFKQAEADKAKARAERSSQKAFLEGLLAKKKIDALEGLSLEEISKQLGELGDEEESQPAQPVEASA